MATTERINENGMKRDAGSGGYGSGDFGADSSKAAAASLERQFIIFSIGAEEYGAPILSVREIRGWRPTTSIPNAPAYVRGVINLRGSVVPVFDLRSRFGGGVTATTDRHVVIMILVDNRIMGVLVDAISDILMIEEGKIQPPPEATLSVDASCIDGLVADNDRMITLINIHKLFGKEDLGVADEAQSPK